MPHLMPPAADLQSQTGTAESKAARFFSTFTCAVKCWSNNLWLANQHSLSLFSSGSLRRPESMSSAAFLLAVLPAALAHSIDCPCLRALFLAVW